MKPIEDRETAGRELARQLMNYANRSDVIVVGLPRGGVAVAYEIARSLDVPLDVFLVQKLGVPGYEELAMGALAMDGSYSVDPDTVEEFRIAPSNIEEKVAEARNEIARREAIYRCGKAPLDFCRRVVILVDDGIATGATIRVAMNTIRKMGADRVVIAAGVAPLSTYLILKAEADAIVCLLTPRDFRAVNQFYKVFPQLDDGDVCRYVERAVEDSLRRPLTTSRDLQSRRP